MYKRFSPHLLSGFSIALMIVTWLAIAPTQAGGLASYVVIIGRSMEPTFHIGDLVIVHAEPTYQIGDAVVYRNQELGSYVFHRIVAEELGRYTLQGDNNAWVDTYQPAREEVLGKLWLHVPHSGAMIQKIRNPISLAALAGAMGAVLAASLFVNQSKGKKRMNNQSAGEWLALIKAKMRGWLMEMNSPEKRKPMDLNPGALLEGSFFLLGLIGLAALILGIIAFSRPASRLAQDDVRYEHLGIFSYSASAPQGIYDSNVIKSGDPIFPRLTCSVDIGFHYSLIAPGPDNVTGTYQLTAVISDQVSGWQRRVPLQEGTSFSGTTFDTAAKLDLCRMEALTQSLEQGTEFHPSSYMLVITPEIKVNGEVSGQPLEGAFDSGLTFQYDRLHFYLVRDEEQGNSLSRTASGILHSELAESNTILLFGNEAAIPALRWIALFGFVGSLAGLGWLGMRLQNLSRKDQQKFLHMKYDSLLVDIQKADAFSSSNSIEVRSMEALAKLAERFNVMILHAEQGNLHAYYVQGAGTIYRFAMNATETESTVPENEAQSQEGEA